MTIILLIVDTSASMAQKTYLGTSYLDVARNIIDALQKSGWRESSAVLHEQLKRLRPRGRGSISDAFMNALKFINVHRAQTGIDNYGCGRFPTYFEPVVLFAITDSTSVADIPPDFRVGRSFLLQSHKLIGPMVDQIVQAIQLNGIIVRFECPVLASVREASEDTMSDRDKARLRLRNHMETKPLTLVYLIPTTRPTLGSEMTIESFRWDQRLYTCVLRYPSKGTRVFLTPPIILPSGGQPIDSVCASTGGRSFLLQSHKLIGPMVDQIVQAIQLNGIIVRFECPVLASVREASEDTMSDRDKARLRLRNHMETKPLTLVYVKGLGGRPPTGHWPIPEAFWHDRIEKGQLPPRRAHPCIVFSIDAVPSPTIQTDLPFDKYQLEPSPVAEYILDRHPSTSTNMCYQVFVRSSSRTEGVGKPFGYLKAASNGQMVNLIIMPYNYPVIVQLLEEYKNDPRVRNGGNWRARLDRYVEAMPPYYLTPLRNAFTKMKMEPALLDERGVSLSQVYPAQLLNYLNDLKTQGKEEFEKTCTTLSVLLQQNMAPLPMVPVEQLPYSPPPKDVQTIAMRMKDRIGRRDRREQETMKDPEAELVKMRISPQRMQLHLPIAQMGNYEEYIKGLAAVGKGPLRPVEPTPVRTHAFGNPFKTDKKSLAIDEVGEGMVGANAAVPTTKESRRERKGADGVGRPPKRKPGPVAPNCLQQWRTSRVSGATLCISLCFDTNRERRRTISERSSVVSDLSYTSDLDLEMPSTSDGIVDEAPMNEMTNGVDASTLNEFAGLELEAESGDEEEEEELVATPPKRRKTERLSDEQMMERKLRIAEIVRRHANNGTVWTDLCRETAADGSLLDQLDLADFALRDSRRFKRRALVDQLTNELQRIRKLLAM
ncbi:hypothetical protein ANCCEY_05720 [Ancylostoma ceylanicum]|uniref:Integrator complex subunit 6-like beta-barrel domain-containing protein n=1 Tax=Ancylostoma ceylanicum TaxID=53326 RepID=A0A0D6LYL4_9BILA|nr:hypothetical protein ANCCEY_05720 [Ancylostoma ceylanicum]